MPTMTAYASGTFCWPELATTDPKAAIEFYQRLFDWNTLDLPIPGGSTYTLVKKGSDDAGAIGKLMDELAKQGVPPHWLAYISVDDVDATVAKLKANGGTVMAEPMDVKPDGKLLLGRMAVAQDPQGAAFALWQPGAHIGASVVNEPGALTWNELMTTDVDAAKKFYTAVFGYTMTDQDMGNMVYTVMKVGGRPNAGLMKTPDANVPTSWLTYFSVDDVDKCVEKAKAAGAKVLAGPDDIPEVGRFAVLQDPQGAVFAIIKLVRIME